MKHIPIKGFSQRHQHAFGMVMPERIFSNEKYRWGFNGKETDNETNWQDYGFRIYYPGLAKFLSVDPLTSTYPMLTPYQFASNSPVSCIDLEGLEGTPNTGFGSDPMATFAYHMSTYMKAAATWFDNLSAKVEGTITYWFAKDETKYKTSSAGVNVTATTTVTVNPSQLFDPNNYSNNTYTGKNTTSLEVEVDVNVKRKTEVSIKTPAYSVSNSTTATTTIASTNPSKSGTSTISNELTSTGKIGNTPVVLKKTDDVIIDNKGKKESTKSSTSAGVGTSNVNISGEIGNDKISVKSVAGGSAGPIEFTISTEVSKKP